MVLVLLTACMVGGATMAGSVMGFVFRRVSQQFCRKVMAFAAGVMLSAAILGLILPAVDYGGKWGLVTAIGGIFCGAGCLRWLNRLVPQAAETDGAQLGKVMLFVSAIAIHNFPEGLAAGVSFGTGNIPEAMLIAGGIALQNLPEGMVTVTPMLAAGIPAKRALCYGLLTGVIEILGTVIGYCAVTVMAALLPFSMAFAGGTMLYVICDEMIPETHGEGNETYALLAGFCLMMASDLLLG